MRAGRRRRQRRALPDQPCRMNITTSSGRCPLGSSWPLKSDCPLECVRACSVCTGCRRDVDRARREIGIDVWIDGKTVRASRAHVPDHQCRCECSLTAATVRPPCWPTGWAGTSRGGSRALRKVRGRHSASNPAPESPSCHPDPLFTPLERRYNGYGRPARPQKRLLWAAPVAAVRVAFSERWRRRRRPPGRPRAGRRRGARTCHVLVRAAPGGPSGCGGVGSPGELRAGARSVGPGPGVVPGCAEAREGVGRVSLCVPLVGAHVRKCACCDVFGVNM